MKKSDLLFKLNEIRQSSELLLEEDAMVKISIIIALSDYIGDKEIQEAIEAISFA